MKNTLFEQKIYKIIRQTAFHGKYNRDYAACLKNAVNFLVV